MVDRHTIAQHSRDELSIVPIFRIKLATQTFNGSLVATLVLELEVVASSAIFFYGLDNLTFSNALWKHDAFFVVLQTCEYFVRITIEQTYECHPLLFIVLETNHIALQFLIFLRNRNHHTRTATITIYSTSLAARAPSLNI